jgi:dihydrofolate reductase
MAKVVYSMGVSVDGFIAGPGGEIDWSTPGDELHRFHNEQARELGVHFLGRRLYETMLYWETADALPEISATEREFARIWQALPKVVFSRTLDAVEGNARLARDGIAEELAPAKEQVEGDIAVGGAGLASTFVGLGLVDEFRLFVHPAAVGGGTPFLPPLEERIDLELVETREFGSRVIFARYAARR